MRWRFRLLSVLLLMALVAIGITAWRAFPVIGVSWEGTSIVFHMSNEYGRQLLAQDPYGQHFVAADDDASVFFHDAYVSVDVGLPFGVVVLAVVGVFTGVIGYLIWRQRQRSLQTRTHV